MESPRALNDPRLGALCRGAPQRADLVVLLWQSSISRCALAMRPTLPRIAGLSPSIPTPACWRGSSMTRAIVSCCTAKSRCRRRGRDADRACSRAGRRRPGGRRAAARSPTGRRLGRACAGGGRQTTPHRALPRALAAQVEEKADGVLSSRRRRDRPMAAGGAGPAPPSSSTGTAGCHRRAIPLPWRRASPSRVLR